MSENLIIVFQPILYFRLIMRACVYVCAHARRVQERVWERGLSNNSRKKATPLCLTVPNLDPHRCYLVSYDIRNEVERDEVRVCVWRVLEGRGGEGKGRARVRV